MNIAKSLILLIMTQTLLGMQIQKHEPSMRELTTEYMVTIRQMRDTLSFVKDNRDVPHSIFDLLATKCNRLILLLKNLTTKASSLDEQKLKKTLKESIVVSLLNNPYIKNFYGELYPNQANRECELFKLLDTKEKAEAALYKLLDTKQ